MFEYYAMFIMINLQIHNEFLTIAVSFIFLKYGNIKIVRTVQKQTCLKNRIQPNIIHFIK